MGEHELGLEEIAKESISLGIIVSLPFKINDKAKNLTRSLRCGTSRPHHAIRQRSRSLAHQLQLRLEHLTDSVHASPQWRVDEMRVALGGANLV